MEPKKKQGTLMSMWKKGSDEKPEPDGNKDAGSHSVLTNICKISYDFEDVGKKFSGEGRTITIEFDHFMLVACYVPNSGQELARLSFRINEW